MKPRIVKSLLSGMISVFLIIGVGTSVWAGEPESGFKDERITKLMRKFRVVPLQQIMPPDNIILKDLEGNLVRLSDYLGKVVFLNFWATWCPPCRIEMPSMEKLYRKLKDREFTIVTINLQETAEAVKSFFKKYQLTFPALLDRDGGVGRRFGIRSIPTTFILNQKGGMIGKIFGPREWDSRDAEKLFALLIEDGN